jgi:predicted nucleic acid-binding protein
MTGSGDLVLARSHSLTTYDAAYLELALRRGLPLASRDKALETAARVEGVSLLPT